MPRPQNGVEIPLSTGFVLFETSMTFHDLFHDLSEFSMAKVKPFFSRQYQNNHLFNVFASILKHKMCACVYFY